MMLQQNIPEDFILATGETHTIKEFIDECLNYLPKNRFQWKKNENKRDILWDMEEWKEVIGIDEKYYRPSEVEFLLGDSSKAKKILGWEAKTKFKEIIKIMMENELKINGKNK